MTTLVRQSKRPLSSTSNVHCYIFPFVFAITSFCACDSSITPYDNTSHEEEPGKAGSGGTSGSGGTGNLAGTGGTFEPDAAVCGDGVLASTESCEGTNLRGVTCETLGLGIGTLKCFQDTCRFDVSLCYATPPPTDGGNRVCTPSAVETKACGQCGNSTRQCLTDGSNWGEWSECDDPCIIIESECIGQDPLPNWNNRVSTIMDSSCGSGYPGIGCHNSATSSYSSFINWKNTYSAVWSVFCCSNPGHYALSADNLATYNCWIALGLPEN